jgi:hypothetical protein
MDANPLTKLRGNTSIISRIQELIDRRMACPGLLRLDHFKSLTTVGFSRGDDVLMMTARVIVNTIRGFPGVKSFWDMLGATISCSSACRNRREASSVLWPRRRLCAHFTMKMIANATASTQPTGRERCAVFAHGRVHAVVFNTGGRLKHYGEASAIAMGLKKKAKENPKSSYVLDRRTE